MYDGLSLASPIASKASTVTRNKRDLRAMLNLSGERNRKLEETAPLYTNRKAHPITSIMDVQIDDSVP